MASSTVTLVWTVTWHFANCFLCSFSPDLWPALETVLKWTKLSSHLCPLSLVSTLRIAASRNCNYSFAKIEHNNQLCHQQEGSFRNRPSPAKNCNNAWHVCGLGPLVVLLDCILLISLQVPAADSTRKTERKARICCKMPLPDIFVPQPGVEKQTLSRTVVITSYSIETNLQIIENEAERQPSYKMKRTRPQYSI